MVLLLESSVRSQSLVDASGKFSTLPSDSDRAGIEAVKPQTTMSWRIDRVFSVKYLVVLCIGG